MHLRLACVMGGWNQCGCHTDDALYRRKDAANVQVAFRRCLRARKGCFRFSFNPCCACEVPTCLEQWTKCYHCAINGEHVTDTKLKTTRYFLNERSTTYSLAHILHWESMPNIRVS